MAMMTKERKRVLSVVHAAYKLHANMISVPILAVCKICDEGVKAGIRGLSDEEISEVIRKEVEKHRVN